MNLTDEELTKLEEAKGTSEWENVVDEITLARGGDYPPDWGAKVIHGILRGEGITMISFSSKSELLAFLCPEEQDEKPPGERGI